MTERTITANIQQRYREHLRLLERSTATVEKYLRDVRAFARYAQGQTITKET